MNNSSAHYMHSSPRSFGTTSPSTQLVDVPRGDESFVSFASTENEQATNKDVTLTVQQIALPVLAVPTEDLHSEYSNLLLPVFYCGREDQVHHVLPATRRNRDCSITCRQAKDSPSPSTIPHFDVSDCEGGVVVPLEKTTNNSVYLGKGRREKDRRTHSFSLHSERENMHASARKTMHVLYDIPTVLVSALPFGKEPPRRVQLALYHEASDLSDRGKALADAVAASIQETGFLDRVADPASGLVTFSHKEPCKNNEGGYALDFFGRCQLAHSANI
mmetsp:Transcript_19568/g.35506  ORF Transcript_19568/g.35506 Transcript_19568/m.35506 type:complete len:275 (-) Transcript_19568:331-1155(-)